MAALDPIHQFQLTKIFTIGHIGGHEIAFTNSSAYMFGAVAIISILMLGASAGSRLIPTRFQSVGELAYEFVADTLRSITGDDGMKFFPAGVLAFHVHPGREHDRDHSIYIHCHQPHHRHRSIGAPRLLHLGDLRLLQARS